MPTSVPTLDLNRYKELPIHMNYTSAIDSDRITFPSFVYKNIFVEGTCTNWQYFVTHGLHVPVETHKIGTIRMTVGTVDPDAYPDVESKSSLTASCTQQGAVDALLNGLQTGQMTYTYCDNRPWRAFYCNN